MSPQSTLDRGYAIVQQAIQDVTKKPFADVLRELVLEPAGMTHSTFVQPLPDGLRDQAATAYRTGGDPVPGGWHTYPELAAAGLWTTPADLARFAIALQQAGVIDAKVDVKATVDALIDDKVPLTN